MLRRRKRIYNVNSTFEEFPITSPRGHIKKRCPCWKCFKWRQKTFSPKVLSKMQEDIRKTIVEDRAINKLVEQILWT